MKPRLERRQSTGFALIELLVSVLIISFGLLSLMALQTQVLRASIGSEDGQRAALLASEMAAAIVNAGTVNLPQFTIDKWTTKVGDPSKEVCLAASARSPQTLPAAARASSCNGHRSDPLARQTIPINT